MLPSSKITKIKNEAWVIGGDVTGKTIGKIGLGRDGGGLGVCRYESPTGGEAGKIATVT